MTVHIFIVYFCVNTAPCTSEKGIGQVNLTIKGSLRHFALLRALDSENPLTRLLDMRCMRQECLGACALLAKVVSQVTFQHLNQNGSAIAL